MSTQRTKAGTWQRTADIIWSADAQSNIAAVSEPRGQSFVGYEKLQIGSANFVEAINNARFIVLADHHFDAMHEALKAWMKVESEMKDNHPSPDLALRAGYRKEAVKLTRAVLAAIDAERNKP